MGKKLDAPITGRVIAQNKNNVATLDTDDTGLTTLTNWLRLGTQKVDRGYRVESWSIPNWILLAVRVDAIFLAANHGRLTTDKQKE